MGIFEDNLNTMGKDELINSFNFLTEEISSGKLNPKQIGKFKARLDEIEEELERRRIE